MMPKARSIREAVRLYGDWWDCYTTAPGVSAMDRYSATRMTEIKDADKMLFLHLWPKVPRTFPEVIR